MNSMPIITCRYIVNILQFSYYIRRLLINPSPNLGSTEGSRGSTRSENLYCSQWEGVHRMSSFAIGGPRLKRLGNTALHYMHTGAWHGSAMSPAKQLKVVRPKLDPII